MKCNYKKLDKINITGVLNTKYLILLKIWNM